MGAFDTTMKRPARWGICLTILVVIVVPLILLATVNTMSGRPTNLGVTNGRLADCPSSPNCVGTQCNDAAHRAEAISFEGPPDQALERLRAILADMPRAKIVDSTENYLHAEFTSLLFRFVDDVEFLVDSEQHVIHFRSASRLGYSDFGANRRRMESIRSQFSAASESQR